MRNQEEILSIFFVSIKEYCTFHFFKIGYNIYMCRKLYDEGEVAPMAEGAAEAKYGEETNERSWSNDFFCLEGRIRNKW